MVLEDASELLMEQLELYRDTRDAVVAEGLGHLFPSSSSSSSSSSSPYSALAQRREQALRVRMEADGNLHPALLEPGGHYKVLRTVSEGIVGVLLDQADYSRVAVRAVSRELFAGCVLRPLMMWCTPYHANKGLYRVLEGAGGKRASVPRGAAPEMNAARAKALQGHWEFEQRIVRTVQAEVYTTDGGGGGGRPVSRAASVKNGNGNGGSATATNPNGSMPPPPPRPRQASRNHQRSRSDDGLLSAAVAVAGLGGEEVGGGGDASRSEHAMASLHHAATATTTALLQENAETSGASAPAALRNGTSNNSMMMNDTTMPLPFRRGGSEQLYWARPQHQPQHRDQDQEALQSNATAPLPRPKSALCTMTMTTTTATTEGSGASITSQTSSISATSPMRPPPSQPPPPQQPLEQNPLPSESEDTAGVSMHGLRPSPFAEDEGSFTDTAATTTTTTTTAATAGYQHGGEIEGEEGVHVSTNGNDKNYGHLIAPSAPSASVHAAPMPHPSPATSLNAGFVGLPRARVVAADLHSSGAKDVVVYKIRVADDSGREWTVSRRYRHFEVLHRQLRNTLSYKSKLPPKRIFIHTQSEDFVEDRRNALDTYLQEILCSRGLARSGDVWEFLRAGSERFEVPGGGGSNSNSSNNRLIEVTTAVAITGPKVLTRNLSRAAIAGASSMKRGVVDVTKGVHDVTNAAVDSVGAVLHEARSGLAGLRHRRSVSVPDELDAFDPGNANGNGVYATPSLKREKERSYYHGGGGGGPPALHNDPSLTRAVLRTATASARKVKNALLPQPSGHSNEFDSDSSVPAYPPAYPHPPVPTPARALHFGSGGSEDQQRGRDQASYIRSVNSLSPTKYAKSMLRKQSSGAKPPRERSPVKLRRAVTTIGPPERSAAFGPGSHAFTVPRELWSQYYGGVGVGGGSNGNNQQQEAVARMFHSSDDYIDGSLMAMGPTIEVDAFGASSPTIAVPSRSQSSPLQTANNPNTIIMQSKASTRQIGMEQYDIESYSGISAPLYELVDCVFQLQTRGFFRRHVYSLARQFLSMAIGDTIDVFLLAKLNLLRQESTVGRVLQRIQTSLWPGGVWFQRTAQYMAAHPELATPPAVSPSMAATSTQASRATMSPRANAAREGPGEKGLMVPEKYLDPVGPPPLDEEEVREAVWGALMKKAPATLVRLLGRTPYNEGVQDLYEMMQSPTFMRQLGYGVLELVSIHLCPELKGLFHDLEQRASRDDASSFDG